MFAIFPSTTKTCMVSCFQSRTSIFQTGFRLWGSWSTAYAYRLGHDSVCVRGGPRPFGLKKLLRWPESTARCADATPSGRC